MMNDPVGKYTESINNGTSSAASNPHVAIARIPKGALVVAILAGSLFASFLSPQLSFWGRGLRLSLPLFFLLLAAVAHLKPQNAGAKLRKFVVPTVLGLAYVSYGVMQNLLDPRPTIFHNMTITTLVCMMVWVGIVLLRSLVPASLELVRWGTLVTLSISLGIGIPLLVQEPGVARLTMGNPLAAHYTSIYFPKGVAHYGWYTPVAFAWPVIANWLYVKPRKRLAKIIGWSLLLILSIAVFLSTFSMAAILMLISILLWLSSMIVAGRGCLIRWLAAIVLFAAVMGMSTLYKFSLSFDATSFASAKLTRIIEKSFTEGLLDADETGRTWMFVDSMPTFLKNPIFGAWGFDSQYYVGGHSSWADTLALQGIFGSLLLLGFLSPSWRRKRPFSVSDGIAGGTWAWLLLIVGGILNPTFNSAIGLLLLWLFDEGGIWLEQRADIAPNSSHPPSYWGT